jgi:imidazole glycerol phosphate synthase glutamine amidotransferase subunit
VTLRVAVLDYRAGNLRSAQKAFERAGAEAVITDDVGVAGAGDLIVVPGVGHFGQCVRRFAEAGFAGLVSDWVTAGKPLFGICVGMQILYAHSEEDPGVEGLDLLPGVVRRLPDEVTVPHMGWDTVTSAGAPAGSATGAARTDPVMVGLDGEQFYFANSYYVDPADDDHVIAMCRYGPGFPCVVRTGSVVGTQFHPEKSSDVGARLLANLVGEHA